MPDVADDCVWRGIELGIALSVLIQKSALDTVRMSRHEIDWSAAELDVRQKFRNPCCAGRTGAADAQLGIDGFDCPGGEVIEFKICLLVAALPEPGQIGLVPHLEVPGANLVSSVVLFQVPDKGID